MNAAKRVHAPSVSPQCKDARHIPLDTEQTAPMCQSIIGAYAPIFDGTAMTL